MDLLHVSCAVTTARLLARLEQVNAPIAHLTSCLADLTQLGAYNPKALQAVTETRESLEVLLSVEERQLWNLFWVLTDLADAEVPQDERLSRTRLALAKARTVLEQTAVRE
jgi:hypothetical protein